MAHLLTSNPELFVPGITNAVKMYNTSTPLGVWRDMVTETYSCNDRGEIKLISHGDMQLPTPFGGNVGPISEVDYDIAFSRAYKPVRIGAKHSVDMLAAQIEHIGDGGKASIIATIAEKFGLAYTNYKNMGAADLFNAGFTTQTTADGIAAFSNSHLLASGTTSNRGDGTSDLALSYSALETMIQKQMGTVSHRGNPSPVAGPFRLIVPVALAGYASRLASSMNLPGTNNNDKNWAGSQIKVVVNPWLTSATAYFLQAVTSAHTNVFYVPQRAFSLKTREDDDYDAKRMYTSEIFGFGFHDFRGIWGTTG